MRSRILRTSLLLALALLFTLSGCKGPDQPTTSATPEFTAAPATETPAPAELVFVDPQGNAAVEMTDALNQFAADNSLQYRTLAGLTAADLTTGTRIVVFASDPGNVNELGSAAPQTQFLILGASAVSAGGNISTIKADPADMAFMAGYITELLAYDWRAAGLLTSDSSLGDKYTDAFTNGARYVCGRCLPYYSPLVEFPVVSAQPSASDETTWASDAAALGDYFLSSVFIDPAAANISVANAVSAKPIDMESVTFISTTDVPDNGITWDALLAADYVPSVKNMLPLLLSGQGGNQADATIILTAVNTEEISPARQDLFNQTAADLAAGKIEPLSIQ
jgi:hypothetical protein